MRSDGGWVFTGFILGLYWCQLETENFPVVPSSRGSHGGCGFGSGVRIGDRNPVMTRAACWCYCEGTALPVPGGFIPSQPAAAGLTLVHCSVRMSSIKKALSLTFCIPVGCVKVETRWMSRGVTTQAVAPMQEEPTGCFVNIWARDKLSDSAGQGLLVATADCGASALSIHACCGFSRTTTLPPLLFRQALGHCSHCLWHHFQSQKGGEAQPWCCRNLAVAFRASVLVGGSAGGGHEWRWRSGDAASRVIHHRPRSVWHCCHLATARPRQVGLHKKIIFEHKDKAIL